jgi:gliding motility-associated-like protein
MQCKDIPEIASQGIPLYNPANMNLMATTVPANHLDQYIGDIGAFDQYALKINYHDSYTSLSKIQAKRYKTDNETQLKFNYKAVLQSITGDDHVGEQPFFKARVINASGAVVDEFCLIGDPTNCIFKEAETMESDALVLYTPNWQSGILDISSIPNNENFTVEFIASRCGLGAHFGYAYIDDICLLHSNENLQGSITLDPLYKICPALPVQACGTFTIPNSGGIVATVQSITLEVRDESGNVAYTSSQPTINMAAHTFCFDLPAAAFPNVTAMGYNVSATIHYGILQTDCPGTNFDTATDDDANPGYDIWFLNCANCPIDLHAASLFKCDTDHNGTENFNLQQFNSMVTANTAGLTFSYFLTTGDAAAATNPIATPANYSSGTRTIYVRAQQSATCFKIIPVQLVVKNPTATISGILNVCLGSTTLTASPGASYLWSNGGTGQSINPTATGPYSVTVTDSFGCQSTASVTIPNSGIAPQPDIMLTQPGCFSDFGSIAITSPASQVSFDNGVTWGTATSVSGLAVGTYTVIVKTAMNCTSYPVDVQLVPYLANRPDVTIVDPTFCGDLGSITITTSAPQYSFDDGATWTAQNSMADLPSGTYQVRVKGADGCMSNYTAVELYGQFLDEPLYTANNPYCGNLGSITIDTPAAAYSFDGGTTWQTSNTLSNLVADSYLLKIRNDLGCTSPNVYVYLTNLEDTYPLYTAVQPGCGTYGSVRIDTPGDLYSFDGGLNWSPDPVVDNIGSAQTYHLAVKKGTCQSWQSYVWIYSDFLPLPVVNDYDAFICDELNDGTQTIDLTNWDANLLASVTSHTFRYFTSMAGASGSGANEIYNPAAYPASAANSEVFVRITGPNGCSSVSKLSLSLLPTPVFNMKANYPLCVGKNVRIDAGPYDRYLWSTGEATPSIYINQAGDYSVTVYENHLTVNGWQECESTHPFHIFWSDKGIITHIATDDWTVDDNAITVYVDGIGDYEYSLDNETFQDSPTFNGLRYGDYTVYVRDKWGCGTVSMEAFLLMYPKFFTPNGDGYNDTWKIRFSETEPDMRILIFDRNGKFVKQLFPDDAGWDGTYNGVALPSSDYWFTVRRQDGKEYKGHFSMKR